MQSEHHNDLQPSEILLHNIVDEEFRGLFKPLYFLSYAFCLRKYYLRDNVVTPNKRRELVACALGMTIVYILLLYTLKYFAMIFGTPLVLAMYSVTYLQYAVDYTILCVLNVFESKINVDILLDLYVINKKLHNIDDNRNIRNMSWISSCVLAVSYFLLVLFKLLLDPLWNWSRVLFITTTLIFDLELLYIVFIANFLACKTETWRRNLEANRINTEDEKYFENGEVLKEMLSVFRIIINAMEMTNKASKCVILFHFVVSFTQALTYIEIQILWSKDSSSSSELVDYKRWVCGLYEQRRQYKEMDPVVMSSHLFGVVLWLSKSFISEALLCVTCEVLYSRIAAARVEVILYFAYHPNCTVRRFKKNVFRLCDTRLEKLGPWKIFSVDAALPLRMAALVANYIIVLLQFAFS